MENSKKITFEKKLHIPMTPPQPIRQPNAVMQHLPITMVHPSHERVAFALGTPVFVITDTIRDERKNESVTGGEKKEIKDERKEEGFYEPESR
jgi:hypothetical protein